jgi:hypothetical protein
MTHDEIHTLAVTSAVATLQWLNHTRAVSTRTPMGSDQAFIHTAFTYYIHTDWIDQLDGGISE